MITTLRLLIFLTLVTTASAQKGEVVVLASIDSEKVSASGLKVEHKRDMPDFTVTYLHGPESGDLIGIYEGAHPSMFSSRGKRLGEVRDNIAEKPVVWTCWSMDADGRKVFGAEVLLPSRRLYFGVPKVEFPQQFHVFIIRRDLKSLAEARKFAAGLIKKMPNKAPEPTPGAVTPRATEGASK